MINKSYKVELEFVVNPYGEDKELPEEELLSKARYGVYNCLDKYSSQIADLLGFPGDVYIKKIEPSK